jgi:hypothetical protein
MKRADSKRREVGYNYHIIALFPIRIHFERDEIIAFRQSSNGIIVNVKIQSFQVQSFLIIRQCF